MSKLIKKGLYGLYVDYPNHQVEIIDESGIKLPLGHAGFALVDLNGNSEYYDYGRYSYRGVGRKKNTKYLGNFVRRSIPNMKKGESSEDYAKRVGEHLKKLTGEKVVVSVVPLPNYQKSKEKLNDYLDNRSDYNWMTNQTCAGVAADIIRSGRSFGGKVASLFGRILGGSGWVPGGMFPSKQRPALSDTYTFKHGGNMQKRLIPKAQFGTGIVRRGLKWLNRLMTPTNDLVNYYKSKLKPKNKVIEAKDSTELLTKLKLLGYYKGDLDGKIGPKSRAAIAEAEANGYKISYSKTNNDSNITQILSILQKNGYYKGKIDGNLGPQTRAAIARAGIDGYEILDNKLVRKKIKKSNISHLAKETGTFSTNNPIVRTIQDLFQANHNKLYHEVAMDPVTGTPLFTKPKGQTIKQIPLDQELALQELIKFKGTPSSGGFTSSDWRTLLGTYTGGNRGIFDRSFGALSSIEHCLGQFNWHTNNKGEIVVTDTFDWNKGETSKDQGWYSAARDYMGRHGTSSNAPTNEKTKYEINLGKPENW